jgi:hypothetical protein
LRVERSDVGEIEGVYEKPGGGGIIAFVYFGLLSRMSLSLLPLLLDLVDFDA